jgi:hemolysin activation/secretion protein
VPEQDIAAGNVEIRILEGYLGSLKVEGNRWFSSDRVIKKYIHIKKMNRSTY